MNDSQERVAGLEEQIRLGLDPIGATRHLEEELLVHTERQCFSWKVNDTRLQPRQCGKRQIAFTGSALGQAIDESVPAVRRLWQQATLEVDRKKWAHGVTQLELDMKHFHAATEDSFNGV